MRYVIFSDIHGNFFALNQMLSDVACENIDGYIFCGDIFGYFCEQRKVIKVLNSIEGLISVMGNHDKNYLEYYADIKKSEELAEKYGASYKICLTSEELNMLKNLPNEVSIDIQGYHCKVVHGTPHNYINGRIYPDSEINEEQLNFEHNDIVFLGHTHYRMYRTFKGTIIINPGSLGQPRDGKGFSYCIFDFDTLECEYRAVSVEENEFRHMLLKNQYYKGVNEYLLRKKEF